MGVASRCSEGNSFFLALFGLKRKVPCADVLMKCESDMEGMSEEHLFSFLRNYQGSKETERELSKLYVGVRSNYL